MGGPFCQWRRPYVRVELNSEWADQEEWEDREGWVREQGSRLSERWQEED